MFDGKTKGCWVKTLESVVVRSLGYRYTVEVDNRPLEVDDRPLNGVSTSESTRTVPVLRRPLVLHASHGYHSAVAERIQEVK